MTQPIQAQNFLSWKDLSFPLKKGVTLIQGFNQDDNTSEGCGKSAIVNALCWGLYGKLPKDARVDDVIKEGEKSCVVAIPIGKYTVIRSRKPNKLVIVDSKGKKIRGKDAIETQSLVEDLVGMSFDTFCQTKYFAQNFPKKFITATQEEKGKILSEIQNIKQFDNARKKSLELIKIEQNQAMDLSRALEKFSTQAEETNSAIEYQIDLIKSFELEKKENLEKLEYRLRRETEQRDEVVRDKEDLQKALNKYNIRDLENNLEAANTALEELREGELKLNFKKSKIKNVAEEVQEAKEQTARTERRISKLKEKKEALKKETRNPNKVSAEKCPLCGSKKTKELERALAKKHQKLLGEVEELDEELLELEDDLQKYLKIAKKKVPTTKELDLELEEIQEFKERALEQKKSLKAQEKEYTSIVNQLETLDEKLTYLNKQRKELKQDIKRVESEKRNPDNLKAKLKELKEKYTTAKNSEKETTKLLEAKHDSIERLERLREGFKEVKFYVFDWALKELARKANQYLQELFEVPIKLKFVNQDMKISAEVEIAGKSRPLGLYSGGQFRRIALAVDLALSDLASNRSSNSLNIKIFDEYMKDLSEQSMEKVLRLLEKLKGTTLLIEHNSIFRQIVDRTFNISYSQGTSSEVDNAPA